MPTAQDLDELAGAFVTASRAILGIAIRSVVAAPVEVTVAQHRVLMLLATDGTQSVGAIARQLGVNPSNATRFCDRLQRLELVDRSRSADDGRTVQVSITDAGRELVDAVSLLRRQEVVRVLGAMPPEHASVLVDALTEFNRVAHDRALTESAPW